MFCSCWGRDPLSLLKESTLRTCQNERPQLSIHQPVHGGKAPWLLNPPRTTTAEETHSFCTSSSWASSVGMVPVSSLPFTLLHAAHPPGRALSSARLPRHDPARRALANRVGRTAR